MTRFRFTPPLRFMVFSTRQSPGQGKTPFLLRLLGLLFGLLALAAMILLGVLAGAYALLRGLFRGFSRADRRAHTRRPPLGTPQDPPATSPSPSQRSARNWRDALGRDRAAGTGQTIPGESREIWEGEPPFRPHSMNASRQER